MRTVRVLNAYGRTREFHVVLKIQILEQDVAVFLDDNLGIDTSRIARILTIVRELDHQLIAVDQLVINLRKNPWIQVIPHPRDHRNRQV